MKKKGIGTETNSELIVTDEGGNNNGPISEVFLFVAADESGEGIMAFGDSPKHQMPMFTSSPLTAQMLKPMARDMQRHAGKSKQIKLLRFTFREELPL